ncbi:hypothetical protein P7C70_g6800, partial [Phenoliferia sp. Uapishka_3]
MSNTVKAPRRSSRQSTPTSPPPSTRKLASSASTPSISNSLAPPQSLPRSRSTRSSLSPGPVASPGGRPPLPRQHANEQMIAWKGKMHKVKTQVLTLGPGKTITIARVKCPVPKQTPGHIIKRFDTGAVSASSLFRAAFPTSSEAEEAAEMKWIAKGSRKMYGDTEAAGVEHDESRKLSGTWIPADKSAKLAKEYGILKFAQDLISFVGDETETASPDNVDSEADSPVAVKSPRASKRTRLTSPLASTPTPKVPKSSLSGASAQGVSILQTLSTDMDTGVIIQTAEVKVDVPISAEASNGLIASDEFVAQQIEEAKLLVSELKSTGALQEMADSTQVSPAGTKRALEVDEDDEELPTEGTMADVMPKDSRGFFGKIFKKAPRRVPVNAGRAVVRARPSNSVAAVATQDKGERRWIAGMGLAVAVGATAAAPFLFG